MSETKASTGDVFLRDDLANAWRGQDPFVVARALEGEVYREVARRRTLKVAIDGRWYFAKLHYGVGWLEIFKNWLTLRTPVIGARNEFLACRHLAAADVKAPTVAAFGEQHTNPATRFSFVVCDALEGYVSLEDIVAGWPEERAPASLRALVIAAAEFARCFHDSGVVHRDFYICHLLLQGAEHNANADRMAVLDLHRAKKFDRIPERWLKRDLAALLFSTMHLPISQRSWLRFLRVYRNRPLKQTFAEEGDFWRAVHTRAQMLHRKAQRKGLYS